MYIADTLSRAYLDETVSSKEVKSLELVDHLETLRVSPSRLARIEKESSQDQVCKTLSQAILKGWPDDIRDCDPVLSFSFVS